MPEIISNSRSNTNSTERSRGDMLYRSDSMADIVSSKPDFLVRWGNYFFLLILLLVGIACWYIRYPDTINTTAKLTSVNAPKPVVTLIGGKLIRLFITESQVLKKGQIIGYLESTASHSEILRLSITLDSIQKLLDSDSTNNIKKHFNINPSILGELQVSYQAYFEAFLSYSDFLANGFYQKKIRMLLDDKQTLIKLHANLQEQRVLQEQDLILTQRTFESNQLLKKDSVISDFDYRIEQSKLINKKLTLPQIRSAVLNNESLQAEKEKEIMELKNTMSHQKLIFQQALSTFRSQLEDWKRKYILSAPVNGKVAYASFVQENQQVEPNTIICYINPNESLYYAEIIIPQTNFGKVSLGQPVLLKMESYPFQEYGFIRGVIEAINYIPNEKGYLAKVTLPNGLITTYHKQVQYKEGLVANAEIITKDMRLLQRFYYNLVKQVAH
jgi:multidrug resistance efflux pump